MVIDLDDNDDAQVIFEVLNGRQTPLSAIDLVKNLLFLRGELAEEDVEKLYDAYWAHSAPSATHDKQPEFRQQRSLVINYGAAASDEWHEGVIAERASMLASAASRVWPSPQALLPL